MRPDLLTSVVVMKTDGTESAFPRQDCKVDAGGTLHLWSCDEPGNPVFFQTVSNWRDVTVSQFDSDLVLERFSRPGHMAQRVPETAGAR